MILISLEWSHRYNRGIKRSSPQDGSPELIRLLLLPPCLVSTSSLTILLHVLSRKCSAFMLGGFHSPDQGFSLLNLLILVRKVQSVKVFTSRRNSGVRITAIEAHSRYRIVMLISTTRIFCAASNCCTA